MIKMIIFSALLNPEFSELHNQNPEFSELVVDNLHFVFLVMLSMTNGVTVQLGLMVNQMA